MIQTSGKEAWQKCRQMSYLESGRSPESRKYGGWWAGGGAYRNPLDVQRLVCLLGRSIYMQLLGGRAGISTHVYAHIHIHMYTHTMWCALQEGLSLWFGFHRTGKQIQSTSHNQVGRDLLQLLKDTQKWSVARHELCPLCPQSGADFGKVWCRKRLSEERLLLPVVLSWCIRERSGNVEGSRGFRRLLLKMILGTHN